MASAIDQKPDVRTEGLRANFRAFESCVSPDVLAAGQRA